MCVIFILSVASENGFPSGKLVNLKNLFFQFLKVYVSGAFSKWLFYIQDDCFKVNFELLMMNGKS